MSIDRDDLLNDCSHLIPFDNIDDSADTFMSKITGVAIHLGHYLDLPQIENVYRFAFEAHEEQKRKSGEPYIIHPISVAIILTKLKQDTPTICAALLHDVVEDTKYGLDDIEAQFGIEIADIVDGVTKVTGTENENEDNKDNKEQYVAETYRKTILATSKNPRTILVKLADRLHNLLTLESLLPEKQKKIAEETLNIYAPIAAEIGIFALKNKLEDISMKYAYPQEYELICKKINMESEINKQVINNFKSRIDSVLQINSVGKYEVTGRVKSIYSIFKKHIDREVPYDEIYDVLGCRIVCVEELECYKILGLLHNVWRPIGDKIKDYIAIPKDNGYKSLHTTLIDEDTGHQVEVQIRTWRMNLEAEYGFAAHSDYKNSEKRIKLLDEFPVWEKEFTDSSEFLSMLKSGILVNEITVYAKKNKKIFKLPDGACVLDLAYYMGSQKGNKCSGAIINGKIVPVSRKLYNNETVDLLTSTDAKPSIEWLSIVKTPTAKIAIKKSLQQMEIDDKTDRAFSLLINSYNYLNKPMNFEQYKGEILKYFGLQEEKALFDKIYSGEITTDKILEFTRNMTKDAGLKKFAHWIEGKRHNRMVINSFKNSNNIRPGLCCNPLPGDKIIAFRMNGDRGISIHRENCQNAFIFAADEDKVIHCSWAQSGDFGIFSQELTILGLDKKKILPEILKILENRDIKLESLDFRKGYGVIKLIILLKLKTVQELNETIKEFRRISGISSVHRNLPVKKIY